jgi:hypothetical protein
MLHEFLSANKDELIARCRAKEATRMARGRPLLAIDGGLPLFLDQLVKALRLDRMTTERVVAGREPAPAPTEIGKAAAQHGVEMRKRGYTVDQVVHNYGDLCQSITELAVEHQVAITADEFHTFNRCLDDAIADAVTSFAGATKAQRDAEALDLHQNLNSFTSEQQRLIDTAMQALLALRNGDMKLDGPTATLLVSSLQELGILTLRVTPGLRLASATTVLT